MTPERAAALLATAGKKPCRNGHLSGRNRYGQCIECKRLSAARKYRRKQPLDQCPKGHRLPAPEPGQHRRRCAVCLAAAVAAGRYRKKQCAQGHDITDDANVVILTNGRHCRICYESGNHAHAPRIAPRRPFRDMDSVSEQEREARRVRLSLEWDDRIERETRAWVREELRQERDRALAQLASGREAG